VSSSLRILHCLRAPAGGLFRRVQDLAKGQADLGHKIGILCDSDSGGTEAVRLIAELGEYCALGIVRHPMPRGAALGDQSVLSAVRQLTLDLRVDILHGHGAKAGAYARLAANRIKRHKRPRVIYTPHGGVLESPARLTIRVERRLAPLTNGIVFENRFAAERYAELVGEPQCPTVIVPGGLFPHEFYEPTLAENAADFVYVGEPCNPKGLDIFLRALATQRNIFPATAIIVGSGPSEKRFRRLVRRLGLGDKVAFSGSLPPSTAFVFGRCVVVPSRTESFPYIALQAAAAQMPLIATDAGGAAEALGESYVPLAKAGDVASLAAQMRAFLAAPKHFMDRAARLQRYVASRPGAERMAADTAAFYGSVLAKGKGGTGEI
jgi:glycosyltransferase involved in cell wall biosynthesis